MHLLTDERLVLVTGRVVSINAVLLDRTVVLASIVSFVG